MKYPDFPPQVLPVGTRSLFGETPPAPPGTIFVLADKGGYAVPPCKYTLLFGRAAEEVHVLVGADDPSVSRKQGVFTCAGGEWWLRNTGVRPIELPAAILLNGHEWRIEAGFTPLLIRSSARRSHLLEVRVTDGGPHNVARHTNVPVEAPEDVYELNFRQRMVLTALAKRYLIGEPYPQPLTWSEVASCLNSAPVTWRMWTAKSVETVVSDIRLRFSREKGVPGLTRGELEGHEPVGNVLNHNLVMEMLRTATLTSQDLCLLGLGD